MYRIQERFLGFIGCFGKTVIEFFEIIIA